MISFKKHLKEWNENSGEYSKGIKDHEKTNDLHESLKKHYKYKDDKHIYSISGYVGGSRSLNNYIWDKHNKTPHHLTLFSKWTNGENHIKDLDNTMNLHKTPHDLTLFSGTRHDPRELKNEHDIVHHPAYLSTSLSDHIAKDFSNKNGPHDFEKNIRHNHMLKIHVPKGHPSIYAGSLPGSRLAEKEREVILPRGTNLKHIKTDTEIVKFPGEKLKVHNHLHHMEVV
jgi:hypothetical protein